MEIGELIPRLPVEAVAAVIQYVRRQVVDELGALAEVFPVHPNHEALERVKIHQLREPLDSLLHQAVEVHTGKLFHATEYATEQDPQTGHAGRASIFLHDCLGCGCGPAGLEHPPAGTMSLPWSEQSRFEAVRGFVRPP